MTTTRRDLTLADDPQVRQGTDTGPAGVLSELPAPVRTCAQSDCERSTTWPRDPSVTAAFCLAHTDAVLIGPREAFVPEWRHRLTARDNTGAVLSGGPAL